MKRTFLLSAFLAAIVALSGCKSHKVLTKTENSVDSSFFAATQKEQTLVSVDTSKYLSQEYTVTDLWIFPVSTMTSESDSVWNAACPFQLGNVPHNSIIHVQQKTYKSEQEQKGKVEEQTTTEENKQAANVKKRDTVTEKKTDTKTTTTFPLIGVLVGFAAAIILLLFVKKIRK